ncbi:MAG: hypothetical protein R6W72_01790 [Desulfurivibrionaceae bacterium]
MKIGDEYIFFRIPRPQTLKTKAVDMESDNLPQPLKIAPFPLRIAFYLGIVLLMANINAIVDMVEHPAIPYFDTEHLVVGAVAGGLSLIMLAILETYLRHLYRALQKIRVLESYLSICANCKKIRIPDSDSRNKESWQPIESYITEKTQTIFSHGICPDCLEKYQTQLKDRPQSQDKKRKGVNQDG